MGRTTTNPEVVYNPTPDGEIESLEVIFDMIFDLILTEENTH